MSRLDINGKRERQKQTVALMIKIYCKKKHGTKEFCLDCAEFLRFAGPCMIFHHPIQAIRHVIESKKGEKEIGER